MANVLQTKVDAQCDRFATDNTCDGQRFWVAAGSRKSQTLTYPTCIWCLQWGWPGVRFAEIFGTIKVESHWLSCGIVCMILSV